MKLTFLGAGSAFTIGDNNYHSNMILENDRGDRLLIDCGSDVRFSLTEAGYTYRDIHHIYVSHLHGDHVGGLEWLAFSTKFDPSCDRPQLYLCDRLADLLWNKVLSGGLSSIQGQVAQLSTYFHVHPIKENASFFWCGLEIHILQTLHIMSGFAFMPSYGLLFKTKKNTVLITTDTQFFPNQMRDFYNTADIIFHDCETAATKSKVHAHYDELLTLPEDIRKKMWLYHYNPGPLPDAVGDGFRGFVKKGQMFNLDE